MYHSKWKFALIGSSIILIVSVCLGLACCQSNAKKGLPRIKFGQLGAPIGRLTFTKRATFPDLPSAVRVYRVQPMESMNAEFLKLVNDLQITRSSEDEAKIEHLKHASEPRLQKYEPLGMVIGGWEIHLYPGGQYSLRNLKVIDSLTGREAKAPSAEEARRTADTFVSRAKLLPDDSQFRDVYDCDVSEWGIDDKVVHSRGVVYQSYLEGMPTTGSFTVVVGPAGEIASVTNKMRRTVPEEPMPILSPNEGLEKLRSNEGHMANGPSWDATAYVDSVKLVYWQGVLVMDLSYIMPVYVFEGEAVAAGKKTVRWKAYIEAIRPELLETEPGHP